MDISRYKASDRNRARSRSGRLTVRVIVLLMLIHGAMLAHSASIHGPTKLEPSFLVAGLSHWKLGRFELFRVNPPLVRMVAALPVLGHECKLDWTGYDPSPGARSEFSLGVEFQKANAGRFLPMLRASRWACIPFSLMGGLFCSLWARELWKSDVAGVTALAIWCWDPNILAHGELITTDCAATSFGVGAGYFFWRWLHQPTWGRAVLAGFLLGLALLSKTSWLLLLALWPALWIVWSLVGRWKQRKTATGTEQSSACRSLAMLCGLAATAVYTVNLGYGFDGTARPLGDYQFFSSRLATTAGTDEAEASGNRFRDSWLGRLPVPLPCQFVSGVDLQLRDFDDYPQRSYLRGEWKEGGWWYYYLYGVAVKIPHGTQLLLLLALLFSSHMLVAANRSRRDLVVLLLPAVTLFVVASSQCEFSHHFRYVLPGFGFLAVFMAGLTTVERPWLRALSMLCVVAAALSTLLNYPHQLAYFNEASGGSRHGAEHLLGSNYDWGQDVPLEWSVYRTARDESSAGHVVLVTEHRSDIAALYPDDVKLLESAVGLGNYDAETLVISLSALRCEAAERRRRYVDFVSTWRARRDGAVIPSYPSPTILQLRATTASTPASRPASADSARQP